MKINVVNNLKNKDVKVNVKKNANGYLTIFLDEKSKKIHLKDVEPGKDVRIGKFEFIVLEHNSEGTMVISKDFAFNRVKFGECNDWKISPIRNQLLGQEYYKKICKAVGKYNIIPMTRDLTSLDGLDDYGTCIDNVSLLTASEYAKYHKILGVGTEYPNWWWLITPTSAPSNRWLYQTCHINKDGSIYWDSVEDYNGVRPVITLSSSVIVKVFE